MKLTDLNPSFFATGGNGVTDSTTNEPVPYRPGVGVTMDCPCGSSSCPRLSVPFANPLDGGPGIYPEGWQRTGEDFETMTLHPSIQRIGGCNWHGWIKKGEVTKA